MRQGIALLAAAILAACGGDEPPEPWDRAEEGVRAAVFRYELMLPGTGGEVSRPTYCFLGVSEPAGSGGGTPFAGRDPAPAVLDRFAGHAFPVLGVSAAVRGADGRPVDRKTGRPGVLLLTGDIRWRRRYDAEIDVLRLAAAGDPSGRTYRVVWRHGRWTVVDVAAEGMP